jgi:hypothetical protein
MGWKRLIRESLGDKKKLYAYRDMHCPYGVTCPSHIPFENAHPPKLKWIERVSPYVNKYKCMYCGCYVLYGCQHPDKIPEREHPHIANPAFLHRKI